MNNKTLRSMSNKDLLALAGKELPSEEKQSIKNEIARRDKKRTKRA